MGRVVKNAPASNERYVVAPPHAGLNGKSAEDLLFADPAEVQVEAEPVFPAAPEAQPIDWPGLHQQAAELIDVAAADAESLLSDAHERVKTIVEEARAGAVEVTERARTEGKDAGHSE